jgi:hypothetical protein
MVAGRGGLGSGQEPGRLLAVQPKRLGVARNRRTPHVRDGGAGECGLLDGVPVEPGQARQPAGHRRARSSSLLKVPGVGLDACPVHGQ